MRAFLKDNLVLVLGISLPLLLVAFFALAAVLPGLFVRPPHYDFLFSDGKETNVTFVVIRHKLYFQIPATRTEADVSLPHLYRYDAATGIVQDVEFEPPDISRQTVSIGYGNGISTSVVIPVDPHKLPSSDQARDTSKVVSEINKTAHAGPSDVPLAELAAVKIDGRLTAPDGYSFVDGNSGYDSGGGFLMLGFAHSSYRENNAVITKNGKKIPITYNSAGAPYYRTPHFIGWIVP